MPLTLSLGEGQGETRSVLEEQTISLGLAMFGLLVQRCTELLKETPAGESTMAVSLDSIKSLSVFLTPMQLCLIVCFPFVSARTYPSRRVGGV